MRIADASSEIYLRRRRINIAEEGQSPESVTLPGFEIPFRGRSFDLWSKKATGEFASAFEGSGLGSKLDRRMFNVPTPLILRVTESDASGIPWEALQRLVDSANRTKLAPVRAVDPDHAFAFSNVGASMSCLVLVGHPGVEPAFAPAEAEALLITAVTEAMSSNGHKPALSFFHVRNDNLDAIAAAVQASPPNVVIYFGHGRNDDGPRLLLSETAWMPLEEMADALFAVAGAKPPFWIFWACSLVEGADQPVSRMGSAGTVDALSASGGVAVLAMRSRISVAYARPMLVALIGAFASGEPLEVAAAYARAAGLAAGAGTAGRMDDAAPAVWSRSSPVEAIDWGAGGAAGASWTAVPLLGADGTLPEFATGLAPVDVDAAALAATWQQPGRYFVTAPVDCDVGAEPAARARFLASAAALRRMGGRPLIPIILRGGEFFDQRLRLWGDAAAASLDPRRADRSIAAAVSATARDGLAGLQRLLAIPDVTVLLSEPPDRAAGWNVLETAPAGATVVVAGRSLPREAKDWTLDQLMTDAATHAALDAAMKAAPLSCAILGVIERPLTLDEVAGMAGESRQDVDALEPALVRVGGRRVLGQTARAKVVAGIGAATVEKARRRCIAMLAELPLDFEALVEVSRQHVELKAGDAAAQAINAAWHEVGDRWTRAQRRRLFALAAKHPAVRDGLEDDPMIEVVQAAVEVQETSLPRIVLDRLMPGTTRGRMLRHALLAECLKADVSSKASRTAMERHAVDAVACAEELAAGDADARVLLNQRHNLARIRQYFDHRYDEALAVYDDIRERLGPGPHQEVDDARLFATCSRNGAECLLDAALRPIDGAMRDRLEQMLNAGRDVAEGRGLGEVAADIDYTLARIAEAAEDDAAATSILDELAADEAREGYPLLAAIAAMRLFWNGIAHGHAAFAWDRFVQLVRTLDLFDHAWAVRVAIRARIRAAKALLVRGGADDPARARALVEENMAAIDRNRGLLGHDDTRDAALTAAVGDILAGGDSHLWPQFAAGPRVAMLPDGWAAKTAAEIWEEAN